MNKNQRLTAAAAAAALVLIPWAGCARVAVEGGDKPIRIDVNVNLRVSHELDDFFAFENKPPQQPPAAATAPTTAVAAAAATVATSRPAPNAAGAPAATKE